MQDDERPRRPDSDRKLRQSSRFARILRVLEMIQGRAGFGAKDMAAELECSERTIFRDLGVLELAGVPWFYDQDDQRYRVRPGYHFPAMNLGDDELIGQATATAITSAPGLDVTKGAGPTTRRLWACSRELSSKLLDDVERVTAVLDLKLADHERSYGAIRTIQHALIRSMRLTGHYLSPYDPKPRPLDLHPYRLCLARQAWYLIARPEESDHPRTYRVARFQAMRPSSTVATVPANFDLKSYFGNAWGVYRGDTSYEVEVRFTPDAADLVTETTWHATQKARRHKDGGVTLGFTIDGLEEIVHWVLGWSGRARVVQPPELRNILLTHLRKAIELNRP